MYTFESVKQFIEQNLDLAAKYGGSRQTVQNFEAQSFGVVQFVCMQVWREQPELEQQLMNEWNDNWHNLFTQMYL